MDRRTVLAFALIGLILILMPYYMQLVQDDRPKPSGDRPLSVEESASRQTEAPQIADAPSDPQLLQQPKTQQPFNDKASPAPSTNFQERDVVIDSELYRAVISTRGGVITSWQLKTYFDRNGNWLELIAPNSTGLGVAIAGNSLDDLKFIPDRYRLEISGDMQDLIVFRAQGPLGPVENVFDFKAIGTAFTFRSWSRAFPDMINWASLGTAVSPIRKISAVLQRVFMKVPTSKLLRI